MSRHFIRCVSRLWNWGVGIDLNNSRKKSPHVPLMPLTSLTNTWPALAQFIVTVVPFTISSPLPFAIISKTGSIN